MVDGEGGGDTRWGSDWHADAPEVASPGVERVKPPTFAEGFCLQTGQTSGNTHTAAAVADAGSISLLVRTQ
jgi:hypothetical protein